MPDVCKLCSGGYWDCGPEGSQLCGPWAARSEKPDQDAKPDQDCCQEITVLVKQEHGKCVARLWAADDDCEIPDDWSVFGKIPIRVQAGKVGGDCVARVFVPPCDVGDC
jgi:hypothetical protein